MTVHAPRSMPNVSRKRLIELRSFAHRHAASLDPQYRADGRCRLILATDVSCHFDVISEFNRRPFNVHSPTSSSEGLAVRCRALPRAAAPSGARRSPCRAQSALQMALKCADLGHPAKQWCARLQRACG